MVIIVATPYIYSSFIFYVITTSISSSDLFIGIDLSLSRRDRLVYETLDGGSKKMVGILEPFQTCLLCYRVFLI